MDLTCLQLIFTGGENPLTVNPVTALYVMGAACGRGRKTTLRDWWQAQIRKASIEIALNNQEDFLSIINATGHATVEMVNYYDTRDQLKNNAINKMGDVI